MPFKDYEVKRRWQRFRNRDKRHPGWRQTYLDYNGMCGNCGEVDGLEFHEPFGEDRGNNGGPKMQARQLFCNQCHADEHQRIGDGHVNPRFYSSMLQQDMAWEIKQAGGLEGWTARFGLSPSKNHVPAILIKEQVHA